MISIIKANSDDVELLSKLAKATFIESHGHSAKEEDINDYVEKTYSHASFKEELTHEKNIYHIIYINGTPAGYSKIILNTPIIECQLNNITKLERIYILKEYHGLKLGAELYNFNVESARKNNQEGMWLYVWTENNRAIQFYEKNGFQVVGSYNFKISDTHFNPNHKMLVLF